MLTFKKMFYLCVVVDLKSVGSISPPTRHTSNLKIVIGACLHGQRLQVTRYEIEHGKVNNFKQ